MSFPEALVLAVITFMLIADGWIKRNRRLQRPTGSDEDFLRDFGIHDPELAPEILGLRRGIGRELGIPAQKLAPGDDLSDLCDRYCPMFTGSFAWNDLYDELRHLRREAGLPATDEVPGRVGRYADSGTTFRYDGRDYLSLAEPQALPFKEGFESGDLCGWSVAAGTTNSLICPAPEPAVRPTYSSDGLLHALTRTGPTERSHVFYFAGRPVAQLDMESGTELWKYLTTDHLGTPIAATNLTVHMVWSGGFEPFGADWQGAGETGIFLRFPGQWEERTWTSSSSTVDLLNNSYSWLDRSIAHDISPDIAFYYSYSSNVLTRLSSPPAGEPYSSPLFINPGPPSLGGGIRSPYAHVVCDCDGGFKWEYVAPPAKPYFDCVAPCIEAHEVDHIRWLKRKKPRSCQGRPEGSSPLVTENDRACTECSAYQKSSKCLEKALRRASRSGAGAYCQFVIRNSELPGHKRMLQKECALCKD